MNHPELGVIKEGAPADLVVIDVSNPANYPIHDVYSHLVYNVSGEKVRQTLVNGEVVYDATRDNPYPKVPRSIVTKVIAIAEKYTEEKPWQSRDMN